MCVKKIVCLAMCVKKIDCRQPADLYIKKTAKKIKRRPKLFFAPLGQQFHLIGILYILPHLNKHEKQSTIYYSCYLGLHVQYPKQYRVKHINIDQSEQYDIWMAQYTVVYGTATMGTAIKTLEYYIKK